MLVAEFKENETRPFDEIMEVFRKYPDFQKYKVDYTPTISFPDLEILPDQRKVYSRSKKGILRETGSIFNYKRI